MHGINIYYTVNVFYYVIVYRVMKRIAMDEYGGLQTANCLA